MRFASLPRLSHYDLLCVCLFTIRNSEDIDTFVLASSRDSDGITCLAGRCHEMSLRTIERSRHSHSTGSIRLSSYLVWVGVKFSNAKEEELLINDASQIGSKKFDFSIE